MTATIIRFPKTRISRDAWLAERERARSKIAAVVKYLDSDLAVLDDRSRRLRDLLRMSGWIKDTSNA